MIDIIKTRIIHLKKEWISLLFWLSFPIIATILVIILTDAVQEDIKIPIGVVLEEESPLTTELYQAIQETPLLRTYVLDENEAIDQLNKQELDSVFVIRKGYESNIRQNNRDQLIMGYRTNLSFGYIPVSEMIVSYVQQDASRSKSAYVVKDLIEYYNSDINPTWDEVIEQSKLIQIEQSLLHSSFTFNGNNESKHDETVTIFKTWSLWAIFSLLSSLLIFDWIIKEKQSNLVSRFTFMRFSFKSYLFQNFIVYTLLLYAIDLLAVVLFKLILNEVVALSFIFSILSYRLLINMGAFLFSSLFRHTYLYYSSAFIVSLLTAILSGAILPVEGIMSRFLWLEHFNPLNSFLSGHVFNIWLLVFILFMIFWYLRKDDDDDVKSK